ncbi:hypothetical protein JCM8547_004993 [Rhodosporidiobolus lusitaniae]
MRKYAEPSSTLPLSLQVSFDPSPLPLVQLSPAPRSPSTPVYAQFATGTALPLPAKPLVVPSIPRHRPLAPPAPPLPVPSPAPPPARGRASMAQSHTAISPSNTAPIEDGPLFRAHLASLEKRSSSLRSSLKNRFLKALESSLAALQASSDARESLDATLEELSATSLTAQSDTLSSLFDRELRGTREEARRREQDEIARGREMVERVKGAIDRLKVVEERRKAFESDSKKYYDELAKYLGRGESDAAKNAVHDAKQAERVETFQQQRVEYFAFLEGLVESEERAVAAWLRTWAGVEGENAGGEAEREKHAAREASLAALEGGVGAGGTGALKGRASGASSKEGWVHIPGLTEGYVDPESIAVGESTTIPTDDNGSNTGSTSDHSSHNPPLSPPPSSDDKIRRRRRSSIPHFHLPTSSSSNTASSADASGNKRDRLKGFLKTASNSIQSALPTSVSSPTLNSDVFARRPSPPPPVPSLPPPSSVSPSQQQTLSPPSQPSSSLPRSPSTAQLRRKEGFLFATEVGQKHTTAGDGGARWSRYWVVLSAGQLVEYDKWQEVMSVHGTINLQFATARMSKNAGDRRFSFEVLTPSLRRVYQAAGEKECAEWVTAISKSIESLLNGTSSVRHFDTSRLTHPSQPFTINEFGSSLSLATKHSNPRSPSPSSDPPPHLPTSPKSRLPDFSFLSRRASLGHGRKISTSSTSKKDKRRSAQSPPLPSLTIGEEAPFSHFPSFADSDADGAPVDRSFFDASTRRGSALTFSEPGSGTPDPPPGAARPSLNGLGIPFPALNGAASRSSPDLLLAPAGAASTGANGLRSVSNPFPGAGGDASSATSSVVEGEDDASSSLDAQDRAIREAVRGWACSTSPAAGQLTSTTRSAEEAKYRNAVRISELAETPPNDRCADCRAEGPRWASWNLGVTICIRCSGVHRSLGTHVSKVRAVELDDWNDEQLAPMEAIGNSRSNAYYEARMSPGTLEDLNDSNIAAFIREKYVQKRWAPLDSPPPSTSS